MYKNKLRENIKSIIILILINAYSFCKLIINFKITKNFIFKKKINLKLNSLTITFEDMSSPPEFQNKKLKIDLPFALLPLFYYKGIQTFQKLLAASIKVENNFNSIYLRRSFIYCFKFN